MTSRIENDAVLPDDVVLLGTITVQMYIPVDNSQPIVRSHFVDPQGDTLPLITTLGMLDIARQTAWDLYNDDVED